jgi:hypothetical protein
MFIVALTSAVSAMRGLNTIADLEVVVPSGARRTGLAERDAVSALDEVGAVGRISVDAVTIGLAEIHDICTREQEHDN